MTSYCFSLPCNIYSNYTIGSILLQLVIKLHLKRPEFLSDLFGIYQQALYITPHAIRSPESPAGWDL